MTTVLGLDGGDGYSWFGVLLELDGSGDIRSWSIDRTRHRLEYDQLPGHWRAAEVICIDAPMYGRLPDRRRQRGCDRHAKGEVSAELRSSFFAVPSSADVAEYLESGKVGQGHIRCLVPYIVAAEGIAARHGRVIEGHPELTFGRLNGGAPLEKKKTPGGILKRVELLPISNHSFPAGDHLDAFAMALTARAYRLDRAVAFTNNGGPFNQQQARGATPVIWSV